MMTAELSSFIDKVYREPYSLIGNNCINKSLRIKAKAEELGRRAFIGKLPLKVSQGKVEEEANGY